MIYRIFVEKKDNVQARKEAADVKTLLNIDAEDLRLVLRYDVEGLSEEELKAVFADIKKQSIEDPILHAMMKAREAELKYTDIAFHKSIPTQPRKAINPAIRQHTTMPATIKPLIPFI